MYYQRVKARLCHVRRWLAILVPTRKQRWALAVLVFLTLVIAGRSERLRRDQLLRATARQTSDLEQQLQAEIDDAKRRREYLQEQVDDIERRLSRLEQRR